jgi:hypothetical protein
MRRQRTTPPGVVGVTGAAAGLGRAFLARHQARPDGLQVVAVDADRDSSMPGVDTLVHLAMSYDPRADPAERARRNVQGTRQVLEGARAGGVRRVVLVTSVDVLAAPPDVPLPAPETLPLRAAPDSALTGDLLEVEAMAGRRRLELPASVALSTAERLHRAGLTPGAPAELDRLLAPLVVEPGRLAAAGWAPGWSAADGLRDHLATRPQPPARLGPSPAAAGATAAGATVALVGTAALVRRARRRRGR